MSQLTYNVANSNPLIPRQQTYVLDRKLVSIHSEDRDIKKYPQSNRFSVELPMPLENVQSIRMVECTFPITYYVFSRQYQNTKMSFSLKSNDINSPYHGTIAATSNYNKVVTIEIQEGFYCPDDLAAEIQERMNTGVTEKLKYLGYTGDDYEGLRCYYDKIGQRFWFGTDKDDLILYFDRKELYDFESCSQPEMWEKKINWGLGWYLGFERETYTSTPAVTSDGENTEIKFAYLGPAGVWLQPVSTKPVHFIKAPHVPNVLGDRTIYMELNKFNSMDELVPHPNNTNAMHNNTWNAIVNSAFAKIPVTNSPLGELNDSRNGFLQNITHMNVPEEKIARLDFLFRYHDGRLVDFGNARFNFTLEFNCIKNEIGRDLAVRIPLTYTL